MLRQVNVRIETGTLYPVPALELPIGGPTSFPISFIDGLSPTQASLSAEKYALSHGEVFQSSRVNPRNIVLTLELDPDYSAGETVSSLRQTLRLYFSTGNKVNLEFLVGDDSRYISGVVETFEAPLFVKTPAVQISIVCHDPFFWSDVLNTSLDSSSNVMEVVNNGEVRVGFMATTIIQPNVVEDLHWSIFSDETGVSHDMMFNRGYLQENDIIEYSSITGNKYVTRKRQGITESYLTRMDLNSDWLYLEKGANQLFVSTDQTAAGQILIQHREAYTGL